MAALSFFSANVIRRKRFILSRESLENESIVLRNTPTDGDFISPVFRVSTCHSALNQYRHRSLRKANANGE